MNSKWSTLLAGGVIAALIVGAGALGAVLARPTPLQAAQAGGGVVRQITVVGTGEAKVTPDQATIQLGVQTDAATPGEALANNSTKMAALIDQLKKLGIAAADIQTSNFSVSPRYAEDGQSVNGYQVNNSVSVVIRDVTKAGSILDQVVSAGANSIYGISFGVTDPKSVQATARDAAIAEARTRAQAMAKTAGGSVGAILTISETIGVSQPLMKYGGADMAQAGSAAPIQAGEQLISAQVQITFELR